MKTLLMAAILLCVASAQAQGTLSFRSMGPNGNAPVTLYGTPIEGSAGYVAQLWYAPAGTTDFSAFQPVATSTVSFQNGAGAGYFFGAIVTMPVPDGTPVAAQVRVWNTNYGATWPGGFGPAGYSSIIQVTPAPVPNPPAELIGMQPFDLGIPEPSSATLLAGAALAAIPWFSRIGREKQSR